MIAGDPGFVFSRSVVSRADSIPNKRARSDAKTTDQQQSADNKPVLS
jgi:hypothetical protein